MQRKKILVNALFAAVILLAAAALFLLRGAGRAADAPLQARLVYGDGADQVLDLPLDEDKVYDVDTGYLTVHIEVRDGAARFVDSPCPDHICEGYGWLTLEDQTATCLPARAVLTIVPAA